ncbi:30S ribosomal protein S1 [Patescibacteria group bacterium]
MIRIPFVKKSSSSYKTLPVKEAGEKSSVSKKTTSKKDEALETKTKSTTESPEKEESSTSAEPILSEEAAESEMGKLLLEKTKSFHFPNPGEDVDGKVISRTRNEVLIDIPGVGTGVVRGQELFDELPEYGELKAGDDTSARVMYLENERGELECSFRRAGYDRVWKAIEELKEKGDVVELKIKDANQGGLIAYLHGVKGFLPVSQLKPEHYPQVQGGDRSKILELLQKFVGEPMIVKVLDVDREEGKLILSEKAAQMEAKKDQISKLDAGTIVEGEVSGVVDFGAFVQFDGLEGLVHISELAWQRVDDPRDIIKVGDKVKVKVIGIDDTRISLSMKALEEDPWINDVKKYKIGEIFEGEVLKLTDFGAFVKLDDKIHGLIHISELSEKDIKNPAEVLAIGEKFKFKIISIEPEEHRLGLTMKGVVQEDAK